MVQHTVVSSPGSFAFKLYLALLLIIIDAFSNALLDHLWGQALAGTVILLFCVTALVHCFLLLLYFTLLWHTFLLKFGLLGDAIRTFKWIYILGLFRMVFLLSSSSPCVLNSSNVCF